MSQIVRDFYNGDVEREWRRLDAPLGQIEFASTVRLIEQYFPSAGQVCDIGAGPGRYSVLLAQQGHRVTVVELSDALLARAKAAFSDCGLSAERFLEADACALRELASAYFDAALMLGPLYHLVDEPKRLAALDELHRLLKPGGIGIVAYLNSWGILRCGVGDFPERYADAAFTRSLLSEKSYRGAVQGFTECFWATPPRASREIRDSGFELVAYCGAEGFAGGMRPMVERVATEQPAAFQNLVRVATETSELPQYRDATEHLHLVVRKPLHG